MNGIETVSHVRDKLSAIAVYSKMCRAGWESALANARVNEGGTPTTALFAGSGVMLLLIATNSFDTILALLAFFFVANYALSFASVFVLRRREPLTPRPFRAIGYPWTTGIALAGSIAFLAASVVGDPEGSVRSLLLLAASVPVFLLVRGRGSSE